MKRPQRNYVRHKKVVDQVFAEFQESLGRPCFTDVSRRSSVPESTVRNWYSQYLKDSTWRPYNTKLIHGTHNRIFTDEQEKAIADYIEANYFAPGYAFHNYDFQILAISARFESRSTRHCASISLQTLQFRHDSDILQHTKVNDPSRTLALSAALRTYFPEYHFSATINDKSVGKEPFPGREEWMMFDLHLHLHDVS